MNSNELGLPIFYQKFPQYFDRLNNHYTDLKNEVVEKILQKYEVKTVLDMTCGTGAQVLYLSKLGYQIVGSDFSPDLTKIAKEKAAKISANCDFLNGDVRTIKVGNFDAVITIDNAIGHLTQSDFEIAIRNIHQNLSNNGIYVFDILNLDSMTDDIIQADNNRMSTTSFAIDGTEIHQSRYAYIDRKNGYFTSEDDFIINDENIKNKCTLKIYTMNDLQSILNKNGFQVIEQHKVDAYTFEESENGYSIITIARKTIF
ncbi:class I SAM-dependent methyltransferase [Candidatus Gromoviella agglomerans]|uniref:class I SAM-dependent methyltransferase n=1 Tax=Candidatus Gromoviella agglomerans TaxID=2806609 RepID=UPI001E61F107|nr:class I SAM-dependent methyltransferase [Candidatus Gromoviella agglomerans]UFX98429.1 SAM-dependent methyltransferase [Candidatus Gromoviella agglomerans]